MMVTSEQTKAGEAKTVENEFGVSTAYFYYFQFDQTPRRLRVYELFDIYDGLGSIEEVVKHLITNANQTDGGTLPRPYSDSLESGLPLGQVFKQLFRRRAGYFIVAMDGAVFDESDPITFFCEDALYPESMGNKWMHTFKSRKRHDVEFDGRIVSVISHLYTAQSHSNAGSKLHDKEWEQFKITIRGTGPGGALVDILYEDSGGTNMGPPPPPPGRKKQVVRTDKGARDETSH